MNSFFLSLSLFCKKEKEKERSKEREREKTLIKKFFWHPFNICTSHFSEKSIQQCFLASPERGGGPRSGGGVDRERHKKSF
ncbi:MAG: hypothetical protein IKN43_00230, partial [Selenomonadaceae bacterium]|nr:hypothetical protein [Selenomonadaceae bacterium]